MPAGHQNQVRDGSSTPCNQPVGLCSYRIDAGFASKFGAGDGNRTHVCSLGSYRSTIELHPRQGLYYMHFAAERNHRNGVFYHKSSCSTN
ncbi:hypothetical protein AERO9A_230046 [Aeromonas salmonicida]|nr:hypothetical protein AERO9A_230046 [Aeromonas salmonicida]